MHEHRPERLDEPVRMSMAEMEAMRSLYIRIGWNMFAR